MKFQKIKNTKHYVYDSYDEFETHYRERGMEVPPIVADWREAGAGDWTYSDDERIVQILVRKVLPNRKYNKNPYVRTVVGSFVVNRFTQMDTDFDAHPSRYRFSKRTKKELYQWRMDRPNLTKNERILIAKLKLNMPVREAWESTYGGIKDWRYKLVDLIKTERFQKEMNQDVDDRPH